MVTEICLCIYRNLSPMVNFKSNSSIFILSNYESDKKNRGNNYDLYFFFFWSTNYDLYYYLFFKEQTEEVVVCSRFVTQCK